MRKRALIAALILTAASTSFAKQGDVSAARTRKPLPAGAVRVPEAAEAANIIMKVKPHGPAYCDMCTHVSGTVVLLALISKSGHVEKLSVLSGPKMLQKVVLEAVRQWQYQPYIVNGKPVEVQTTITVPVEWPDQR